LESPLEQQRFVAAADRLRDARQPREVIELTLPDTASAVQALLRGDVVALDHIFPSEAAQLAQRESIRVEYYPMPLVHLLIPTSEHPFLANRLFRRALVYGIDRENIVRGELLGGRELPGCQVISGPLPAGRSENDPLGYGYDRAIEPHGYQPGLSKLLLSMTERQLRDQANHDQKPAPELTPLKLAHPAQDLARVGCEAIKQQLGMVGIPVELVELPPGSSWPEPATADLVYASVAMWEPSIDLSRVLGPAGLARSQDQLLGQALRRLEAARNWREVRSALFELHRIAHNELPVIPLYQLFDAYAYRADLLQGVGENNVSLYQQVDQWRVRSQAP
jgi:ABC-type transport system substrate-binding protein